MKMSRTREKLDSYYTCQECKEVTNFCKFLNDKPICSSCLDEVLHGDTKRLCAKRGYHETCSSSTDTSRCRDESMTTGRVFWNIDAGCRCGISATFHEIEAFAEEEQLGRAIPRPPRFWKFEKGSNKPIVVDVI